MAVPDTNTFALTDVIKELGLTLNSGVSLGACFTASVDASFDAAYKGSKDRLSNFRNYAAVPVRAIYGYLYNWYVASNALIAPTGWHVATNNDLKVLAEYIDPLAVPLSNIAGAAMKETGLTHWLSPNTGATNSSGFTGRGSGNRDQSGAFIAFKDLMEFWSSELPYVGSPSAVIGALSSSTTLFGYYFAGNGTLAPIKQGNPIRLIKDNNVNPGTITDYEGNPYDCVTIGTQVWLVQNWKCRYYNNGVAIPKVTDGTAWSNLTTAAYCAYDNDENNV